MKKLTILLILFISLIFVIPIQVPAAWLNSVLRFSKNQLVKEQAQFPSEDSNNMVSESQRISQNIDTMEKTNAVVPVVNFQLSDIKTINDLKTEIVMLKTNLDNLYKAHNGLVNGHNTLLKSTTGLKKRSAILQNQSTTSSVTNTTSDILYRISELERKEKFISDEIYGDSGLNANITKLQFLNELERLESKLNDTCETKIVPLIQAQ